MSQTLKQTLYAVIKRFDFFSLAIYSTCIAAILIVIVVNQNKVAERFSTSLLQNNSQLFSVSNAQNLSLKDAFFPSQLLMIVPTGTSQKAITPQSPLGIVRTITIEAKSIDLVFSHPLWLMFSSIHFLIFNLLFGLAVGYARISIMRTIESELLSTDSLENWANLSKIRGEVLPVNDDNTIAEVIQSLQQQLKIAKSNQGRVDQLIREQALLDVETGIGNREFFTNRLEALLHEEDARGAVFLIQVEGCDVIQSLYGSQQSVGTLETLIQIIKNRLHHLSNYFIARRSEYEIALLIPGIYPDESTKLADKLLESLLKIDLPVGVNKDEFVHIGLSNFNFSDHCYQVMAEVDMALRSAQLQGPSQWFMYDDGEVATESAKGSLRWRTFLTKAIERNAFVIFFQPVIAANTDFILHHEVLSKVRDRKGKLISARVFLPMAQKCGLSIEIDKLVFDQVCRLLKYEQKHHDACSLNISIDSLLNEDFIHHLILRLSEDPVIAKQIIIEISEYHLVHQLTKLTPVLKQLSELGIRLLADKVGQYIVSTDYLELCPINYVKLHRSIVYQLQDKIENQVFIQSLKMRCVESKVKIYALGVESKEEWHTLVRLGITGGQGHFFTEPVAQMADAIVLPQ